MINLLYCGNDKVFDGMLTSLLSIMERSAPDVYRVYLFTMDLTRIKDAYTPISDSMVAFLDKTLKTYNPQNEVIKIDVTEQYENDFHKCPNEGAYCSPYTLIRLFADKFDMPDKLLYLDADIMFNRDIHLLYDIDVDNVEYAASNDHYGKYLINPRYINAGVILFNMKKCKETGLFEKARGWIKRKKLTFADQSAIIRSTTKKKLIAQKFNDQKFLHKHTVVRHFSKRLFWFPYPHTDNIKQYHIEKVHKVFKYHQWDDVYDIFLKLKKEYEGESNAHTR
ncbi:MAG: lipopolysaccharide biosynthesis protein [Bacilli bacterium]|nr:lipopolysaccharide biosynthesis protein [Bacilli bacterium]